MPSEFLSVLFVRKSSGGGVGWRRTLNKILFSILYIFIFVRGEGSYARAVALQPNPPLWRDACMKLRSQFYNPLDTRHTEQNVDSIIHTAGLVFMSSLKNLVTSLCNVTVSSAQPL